MELDFNNLRELLPDFTGEIDEACHSIGVIETDDGWKQVAESEGIRGALAPDVCFASVEKAGTDMMESMGTDAYKLVFSQDEQYMGEMDELELVTNEGGRTTSKRVKFNKVPESEPQLFSSEKFVRQTLEEVRKLPKKFRLGNIDAKTETIDLRIETDKPVKVLKGINPADLVMFLEGLDELLLPFPDGREIIGLSVRDLFELWSYFHQDTMAFGRLLRILVSDGGWDAYRDAEEGPQKLTIKGSTSGALGGPRRLPTEDVSNHEMEAEASPTKSEDLSEGPKEN